MLPGWNCICPHHLRQSDWSASSDGDAQRGGGVLVARLWRGRLRTSFHRLSATVRPDEKQSGDITWLAVNSILAGTKPKVNTHRAECESSESGSIACNAEQKTTHEVIKCVNFCLLFFFFCSSGSPDPIFLELIVLIRFAFWTTGLFYTCSVS